MLADLLEVEGFLDFQDDSPKSWKSRTFDPFRQLEMDPPIWYSEKECVFLATNLQPDSSVQQMVVRFCWCLLSLVRQDDLSCGTTSH